MRQPIILSTRDIENMKNKNMDGYLKVKDNMVKWGSSSKQLNNYICPRIWCIKCNVVLTEKQLIEIDYKELLEILTSLMMMMHRAFLLVWLLENGGH